MLRTMNPALSVDPMNNSNMASTSSVLASLPEHDEQMNLHITPLILNHRQSNNTTNKRRNTYSGNHHHNTNKLEESWNGLFLASISDFSSQKDEIVSNKKLGHTSFTDLGLYATHSFTTTLSTTSTSTAHLRPADIQAAKKQFMKMRFQRMLTKQPHPILLEEASRSGSLLSSSAASALSSSGLDRLHQSDSALLRKTSTMDTEDMDGAWYKAKHPRHALEQMAHSAPAGSLDLQDLQDDMEEDDK